MVALHSTLRLCLLLAPFTDGTNAAVGAGDRSRVDVVTQLQQLAALHTDGSLTAAEFSRAKQRVLDTSRPGPPPAKAINVSAWRGKRLMVITAHPDDAEYFAGGLIATFTAAGGNASYLIMTNGDGGGNCYDSPSLKVGPTCEAEELALIRRREMLAAAQVLNVSQVWRGDLEDGMTVSYHESLVRPIHRVDWPASCASGSTRVLLRLIVPDA